MSPPPDGWGPKPNLDSICDRIRDGEKIRFSYPEWGTFEIDGRQPYLCVHRERSTRPFAAIPRRSDLETASLITPMASHVLVAAGVAREAEIRVAFEHILEALEDAHGLALLVEFWAGEHSVPTAQSRVGRQHLGIVAPDRFAPSAFLEAFETSALATAWPGGEPEIEVRYGPGVQPPGRVALPLQETGRTSSLTAVGLEVAANFRSAGGSLVYPAVLRETRRALVHVMKQSIYAHVAPLARARTPHFHSLGAGAVEESVWAVDRALTALSDRFDPLLLVTPVNARSEWYAFERSGFELPPEFHYRPLPIDPAALKRALYEIPVDEIDDPALHGIYADKRSEMDRQLGLLHDRGRPEFSLGSLQIHGRVDANLHEQACALLGSLSTAEGAVRQSEALGADAVFERVREELAYYAAQDTNFAANVELRDDVTGFLVSKGNVLIGRDASISPRRLDAVLQHEVGIHALTYHNGKAQRFGILHSGMAGYEELQEGIAVMAELLVGQLTTPRVRQLAARVIATHAMEGGADFVETFRILRETWGIAAVSAYYTAMRVYRGGGHAKDAIYLRGFERARKLLTEGVTLDDLVVGKIAADGIEVIEELRWRGLLEPPRLRPRFLDRRDVGDRLERVRKSTTLHEFVVQEVS